MLLFGKILWHNELIVVEACLVFGGRRIIIVLNLLVRRPLVGAGFSVLLCRILLEGLFFGAIRSSIISRARITVFALAGCRAAPLTPALGLFLRGIVHHCSIAISILWSVHHIYVI